MPDKLSRWTSRKKKRRSSNGKKKLGRWILAAVVTFALLALPLNLLRNTTPVSSVEPENLPLDPNGTDPSYLSFLQTMLSYNIPGLEHPPLAVKEQVYGAFLNAFHSLTGYDPTDPRSFLAMELSAVDSLPVFVPPDSQPEISGGREPKESPGPPDFTIPEIPFPFQGYNDPVILVYHNHSTESFVPSYGVRYSDNLEKTVVRLGDELVKLLRDSYGLPVIHERGIYDLPRSYAYQKARPAIEQVLAENPQVNMVVDLHRDGVRREVTTAVIEGREIGKILLVVGTGHPEWEENYRLALRVQQELVAIAPGLSRGILKYGFNYNQDLHPASLLVEIGGHENTMEEAMLTVPYLAEALARVYYIYFVEN